MGYSYVMSDEHCDGCGHLSCICSQASETPRQRSDQAMKESAEVLKRLKVVLADRPICLNCQHELVPVKGTIYKCLKCGAFFFSNLPLTNVNWAVQVRSAEHIDLRFMV